MSETRQSLILDDIEYQILRVKFRKFIALDEIQNQIIKATETQDDSLSSLLCSYVSVALSCPRELLDDLPWKDVVSTYLDIVLKNVFVIDLPFLKRTTKKEIREAEPWEYPGRAWYAYSHMMAKEYGWTLEYIGELEVEDAFRLLQEIVVDAQLLREWQWDISEKSTGYDEATKKARHIELPRPDWMRPIPLPPKKVKIPMSYMPVGNVIRPDGSHVEYTPSN